MTLSEDLIRGARAAAEYIGPSVTTRMVFHMAENGHLPCIRKGRALFFRKSDLDEAFTPGEIAA